MVHELKNQSIYLSSKIYHQDMFLRCCNFHVCGEYLFCCLSGQCPVGASVFSPQKPSSLQETFPTVLAGPIPTPTQSAVHRRQAEKINHPQLQEGSQMVTRPTQSCCNSLRDLVRAIPENWLFALNKRSVWGPLRAIFFIKWYQLPIDKSRKSISRAKT